MVHWAGTEQGTDAVVQLQVACSAVPAGVYWGEEGRCCDGLIPTTLLSNSACVFSIEDICSQMIACTYSTLKDYFPPFWFILFLFICHLEMFQVIKLIFILDCDL